MKTRYLLSTSLVAASLLAAQPASAEFSFGLGVFGGPVSVSTATDSDGNTAVNVDVDVLAHSREARRDERRDDHDSHIQVDDGHGGWKPYVRPDRGRSSASTDFDGKHIESHDNGNGTRTVTTTDSNGNSHSEDRPNEYPKGSIMIDDGNGGWKPYEKPAKSNVRGSTDYDGKHIEVIDNGNGTHTINTTDSNGKTTSETHPNAYPQGSIMVDDGNGGWKPYVKPPKSNVIGSTDFDGKHVEVIDNGNDTHTVNTTDSNGNTTSETHPVEYPKGTIMVDDGKSGWKPYVKPPKSKVIGSTDFDGKHIEVADNGDGTHTVNTTDENGHTTSETHR
jgi:hypothetical protein